MAAVEEGDDAEVRKLFDTNYFGVVDTLKAVLPGMRDRRRGHVINISSMTGLVANPRTPTTRRPFALEALTEALSKEVAPLGIKVTAIEPGAFRTDWAVARSMQESSTPDRRLRRERRRAEGHDQGLSPITRPAIRARWPRRC